MTLLYLATELMMSAVIFCNCSCISQHLEEPFEPAVPKLYAPIVYLLPISEPQEKENESSKKWNIFPFKVFFIYLWILDMTDCQTGQAAFSVTPCYAFPPRTLQHPGGGLGN